MAPKGQRIGYVRVSSYDQNEDRQLELMGGLDRIFKDKTSGKDTERPGLKELLDYAREGDPIVVHSMDRFARNLDDLRQLVYTQTSRGICVQFNKENLTFSGEDSPMSHLMLSVLGGVAQFEREHIKERQKEGIFLAKKRGVYKGRKKSLSYQKQPSVCCDENERAEQSWMTQMRDTDATLSLKGEEDELQKIPDPCHLCSDWMGAVFCNDRHRAGALAYAKGAHHSCNSCPHFLCTPVYELLQCQ